MMPELDKKDYNYIIVILVIVLIATIVQAFTNSGKIVAYASFAGTLLSIVLSVLAIFYAYSQTAASAAQSQKLTETADTLKGLMPGISSASKQMTDSTQQISSASNQMTDATEGISAASKQVTDATDRMMKISSQLEDSQAKLKQAIEDSIRHHLGDFNRQLTEAFKAAEQPKTNAHIPSQKLTKATMKEILQACSPLGLIALYWAVAYKEKGDDQSNIDEALSQLVDCVKDGAKGKPYMNGFLSGLHFSGLIQMRIDPFGIDIADGFADQIVEEMINRTSARPESFEAPFKQAIDELYPRRSAT